jgi:hypothetical protein
MAITKVNSLQVKNVASDLQTQIDGKIGFDEYVVGEVPSGTVNGVNTTFTLANTPTTDSQRIIVNGIDLTEGIGQDYTISGDTITFATAPETGDVLLVDYVYDDGAGGAGGSGGIALVTGTEIATNDTLDGSTLYKKYISFGTLPNTGTKNVAHGISWNEILSIECRAIANTGERMMVQSFVGTSARFLVDSTNLTIITTFNGTTWTANFLVTYTKA